MSSCDFSNFAFSFLLLFRETGRWMVWAVQTALEVIGSAEEVCEMEKEWWTSGYYPPI